AHGPPSLVPIAVIVVEDALLVVILARDDEMAASVAEIGTPGGRQLVILAVAAVGQAALRAKFEPGEIGVEDEVDYARYRVRAVGGGGAAGGRLDALDHRLG